MTNEVVEATTNVAAAAACAAQTAGGKLADTVGRQAAEGQAFLKQALAWLTENGLDFAVNILAAVLILLVGGLIVKGIVAAVRKALSKSKRVDELLRTFICSVVSKTGWAILFVIALGIFCGVAGAAHNRGMFWMTEQFDKIRQHAPYTRLIIPFLASGVLIFLTPDLACGGDAIVEKLATQQSLAIGTIALLLLGKYLFTTLCFGSGAPGGTLFPLCVMGALLGCLFGRLAVSYLGLPSVFVTNFIVLGIGGLFASVVRAPVTAVVLAFELTGSMDALLSVSIVSILSYVTANLLQVDAFYEHLLGRLLGNMGRKDPDRLDGSGEKCLQNFVVGAGSECEGKLIRDIAWPESVRVVLIDRAGEEVVPTGSVKLQALDKLLLILDANKQDEVRERLWQMLGSSLTSNWRPKSSRLRRKIRKI